MAAPPLSSADAPGSRSDRRAPPAAAAGPGAVGRVAFTVAVLSCGGSVIVPPARNEAVHRRRRRAGGRFLNAAARGQVTPGPEGRTTAAYDPPPAPGGAPLRRRRQPVGGLDPIG
ncbi:hypothetical protein ACWDRR_05115 [Kitasatospora sp. NPDC003701]